MPPAGAGASASGGGPLAPAAGNGLSVGTQTGGPVGTGGVAGGAATTVAPGLSEPGNSAPFSRSSGSTSGLGSGAFVARGVTASTITIGVQYAGDATQGNAAAGASHIQLADPTKTTDILVNEINAHGGVAGRKLQVSYFVTQDDSATPYATQAQSECADFTQDHPAFLVIDTDLSVTIFARPCLARAGVPEIIIGQAFSSSRDYAQYPLEVDPQLFSFERIYATLIPTLASENWFTPWNRITGAAAATGKAKCGVVSFDYGSFANVLGSTVLPGLRSEGCPVAAADVIEVTTPASSGEDGATVSQIQGAVLKLDQDGVDHVILLDPNGSLDLFFLNDAYSQRYFPRYGGTSGNLWQTLIGSGDVQPQTLNGAEGIGWIPLLDVPYTSQGAEATPARSSCFQLMRNNGNPPTAGSTAFQLAASCDVFFFVQHTLDRVHRRITPAEYLSAVNSTGQFTSAETRDLTLGAQQHDGITDFWDMSYSSNCQCVVYRGGGQRAQ